MPTCSARPGLRGLLAALTLLCGQALGTPATAGPSEDLQQIFDDYWAYQLEQNPVFATRNGVRDFDDRLASQSPAAFKARAAAYRAFMGRLDAIDEGALAADETLNRDLLGRLLTVNVEGIEEGYYLLSQFQPRGAWHTGFAALPVLVPFFTRGDYESYLARLTDYTRYNAEGLALLREGLAKGVVQGCAPLKGFENSITTHIVEDPDESVFMAPFKDMPETIPQREADALQAEARAVIEKAVVPAYRDMLEFYTTTYGPACRKADGIAALPEGKTIYAHAIRLHTTTAMSAQEIHDLGLAEVERILAEMDGVIAETGFDGDRAAFVEDLRTNPKFYPKTPEERLMRAAWISKRMDGEMPKLFGRLPRMPYTVKPIPLDVAERTTTAYYRRPSPDGSVAGAYYVNTTKLDQRPLYELEALSLHEAVPGHHHQLALAQELDMPEFRRHAGFTSFIEGWGLYAERLGLEAGFYEDPYADYGRLSYEMWRACRLVVDTGMHALGWDRQRAIDFMATNTALSLANIEAEVDRYISWPGQALAYKIGELRIRALRSKAEDALGEDFDIRSFHDALLSNGTIPLDVLEAFMDGWVAGQLNAGEN